MQELMEYPYAAANMYAVVWGLDPVHDRAAFEGIVTQLGLSQPEWTPPTENVNLSENDDDANSGDTSADAEELKAELYKYDTSTFGRYWVV